MNFVSKTVLLCTAIIQIHLSFSQHPVPSLQKKDNATQLIVDGKPFIILGGELGNSSATTMQYMQPIWPKLNAMNLNTLLVPVFWELAEPEEGRFDFSLYRQLIEEARTHDLKIIFLWFASWKNSMSGHVPAWVKLDQERFPRVKDDQNRSHEILTPFSENNLQSDLNAFEQLMSFIWDFDEDEHTVIMIQVENEIGMLPTARDQDTIIQLGNYEFTFGHEYTLGWSPGAGGEEWPLASAIIIQTGENEFYIAGSGVVVTFKNSHDDSLNTGILKAEEGFFENNQWVILRHLNGDQIHQGRHIRIPYGEYTIQKFNLYTYK